MTTERESKQHLLDQHGQPAVLHIQDIEPISGAVRSNGSGYDFHIERLVLVNGKMPRAVEGTLEIDGRTEAVELENINVRRIVPTEDEETAGAEVFLGTITLHTVGKEKP